MHQPLPLFLGFRANSQKILQLQEHAFEGLLIEACYKQAVTLPYLTSLIISCFPVMVDCTLPYLD